MNLLQQDKGFPIIGTNLFVPWELVLPHEAQAKLNHYQTLDQIASRGGLSPEELGAILLDVSLLAVYKLKKEKVL